jgi:hypothetical protein
MSGDDNACRAHVHDCISTALEPKEHEAAQCEGLYYDETVANEQLPGSRRVQGKIVCPVAVLPRRFPWRAVDAGASRAHGDCPPWFVSRGALCAVSSQFASRASRSAVRSAWGSLLTAGKSREPTPWS